MSVARELVNWVMVLAGDRQNGKTTAMVHAIENLENSVLVVRNEHEAHRICSEYKLAKNAVVSIHSPSSQYGLKRPHLFDPDAVMLLLLELERAVSPVPGVDELAESPYTFIDLARIQEFRKKPYKRLNHTLSYVKALEEAVLDLSNAVQASLMSAEASLKREQAKKRKDQDAIRSIGMAVEQLKDEYDRNQLSAISARAQRRATNGK